MNEEKYLSVTEFAEAIRIHPQTVRDWDRTGKLKAHHKTMGGKRFYTYEQVKQYKKQFFADSKNTSSDEK